MAAMFGRREKSTAGFGYAVVGLGRIAGHFLKALESSPLVRTAAVVSGDAGKATAVAKKHNIEHALTYADADRLAEMDDIHAVYLALPVSMHLEWTERCAALGKHVLVEKPMASSSDECSRMIAACRKHNVLLSVAYRCPYDPLHQKLRELLRSGAVGRVRRIDSTFGFVLDLDDWRYDAKLAGGGSLFDLGIYSLNASRYLLGQEPVAQTAEATTAENGLETSVSWTSIFPNGAEAHCKSSYLEKLPDRLSVLGELGTLTLDPAFSHRDRFHLNGEALDRGTDNAYRVDEHTPRSLPSHFRLEAEELAKAVQDHRTPITPGEDGLADLIAMEAIYGAAGVRR